MKPPKRRTYSLTPAPRASYTARDALRRYMPMIREAQRAHRACQPCSCSATDRCGIATNINYYREELRAHLQATERNAVTHHAVTHIKTGLSSPYRPAHRRADLMRLRLQVKEYRESLRDEPRPAETLRVPGLRSSPRRTLDQLKHDKSWKYDIVRRDAGPLNTRPHVGIELELGIHRGADLEAVLANANLALVTSIAGDGSVHVPGDHEPIEVRLCCQAARLPEYLPHLCGTLRSIGGMVNNSCGLHVHLDMRRRDWRTAYARLARSQPWLMALVSPSRRTNQFARRSDALPDLNDRYRAINACAVGRHSTLEIRLHQGTLNAHRILRWTELLHHIIDTPTNTSNPIPRTLAGFSRSLQLPPDLARWMNDRITALNGWTAEGLAPTRLDSIPQPLLTLNPEGD